MIISSITLALIVLTAAESPTPPPVILAVAAVHATNEGSNPKSYDPALKDVKKTLEGLKFDTYQLLRKEDVTARSDQEASVAISPQYTLYLKVLSQDSNGSVRLSVRIEMAPKKDGDKPVNALSTTLVVASDKQFVLGGLKLDQGELVVVLALKDDPRNPSVHGSMRFRFSL